MAEECAICKREIGDLEEGPYSWSDGDKLRNLCKACNDKQGVVEGGPKAWQRYQEGDNYISKDKIGKPRFDAEQEEKEQRSLQEQDDERARATGERESDDSKDK